MSKLPSTKSLFRAISGKGAADNEPLPLMPDAPVSTRPRVEKRRDEDFYPTGQPEAIRALFAYDGERIRDQFIPSVWEPACGDGAMAREIRAMGLRCVATDLIDRGCPDSDIADFYAATRSPARAIITNPPYGEISSKGHGRWLRHTLALTGWDYLALLLSWEWPAAKANGLGEMLEQQPFSWCYLMRWKIDFTGEGNPAQRNAWFVWDKRDPRGPDEARQYPDFRWMDRIDARQEVLF